MLSLFLTVAEEVTKYTDIISNVIGARFGELLGIVSIPTIAGILINQSWATVRGWITTKKKKKADLKLVDKLNAITNKIENAENSYTDKLVSSMSSRFDELETKYSSRSEEIAKAKSIAINKVLGISEVISEATNKVSETATNTLSTADVKVDEVIDTVISTGDVQAPIIANQADEIVEKVSKKAKKIKDKLSEFVGFER